MIIMATLPITTNPNFTRLKFAACSPCSDTVTQALNEPSAVAQLESNG